MNIKKIKTTFSLPLYAGSMLFLSVTAAAQPQESFTQQSLSFPRERMHLDDRQVLIFNGYRPISPRENSMTGFCYPELALVPGPYPHHYYEFFINFTENTTGKVIRDDVPLAWLQRWDVYDPNGCNIHESHIWAMVTQDELWMPNLYIRKGTFFKNLGNKRFNFGIKTGTSVSSHTDETYLWIEIHNRDTEALSLTLTPVQEDKHKLSAPVNTPFEYANGRWSTTVSSDIADYNDKGFLLTIPAESIEKRYFAIRINRDGIKPPVVQKDIAERFEQSQKDVQKRLEWASSRLPMINTGIAKIDALYYRSIYTTLLCRYERDDFISNPFWSVGNITTAVSWDTAYASDMIAMLDPESLREAVNLHFRMGKMETHVTPWSGADPGYIYLVEPFNLKIMIENYMKNTGDTSILNDMAGDATIYQWMKRWANKLHDKYGGRPDGLIDIGADGREFTEIRTDGYSHIVPLVNIMTADLYLWLARWSSQMNDRKEGEKFAGWAALLRKSIDEKLWNEKSGWYDNLYPDGSKASVWSYHLFDVLESDGVVDTYKMMRMMSHIREGVFLGKFGVYSIARNDTIRWDRIDADWGGGGQYCGMPFRIAKNMIKLGNSAGGWDLLNRVAGYTDYFPYLPQCPRTDKPFVDVTTMSVEVSAGACVEAILSGVFGISKSLDGTLTVEPITYRDLTPAEMKGLHYRGHNYDIQMEEKTFSVWRDGRLHATLPYGNRLTFKP